MTTTARVWLLAVCMALLLALASNAGAATLPLKKKPNLILFLTDDFGWANIGYHRTEQNNEVRTPIMDALANEGVKLERFYAYHMCSPSRCALQSGRYSQHVNVENAAPETWNPDDKVSGYAGIPIRMTTIAQKLKKQGYRTAAIGKWDVGMATPQHTPKGRGYDQSLIYYNHANDYYTCGVPYSAIGEVNICLNRFLDLSRNLKPASKLAGTKYEEDLFADFAVLQIKELKENPKPLFLFYSSHLVHSPLQVPDAILDQFSDINNLQRRYIAAMTYYMDLTMGKIVQALKDVNEYDNTLILFLSDNGGAIYGGGGANNYPLRAGKYSDFEGGVRVSSFVSGGYIPLARRGTTSHNLIHISDVYASFLRLAIWGAQGPPTPEALAKQVYDPVAAKANLYQPDSVDTLWGAITNSDTEPKRGEIWISSNALLLGEYKLVTGSQVQDIYQGPFYPNNTGDQPAISDTVAYSTNCGARGCLFNVFTDPTEHQDLSTNGAEQARIDQMLSRLAELNQTLFMPDRGNSTIIACVVAKVKHGGFYGPFLKPNGEPFKWSTKITEF